MMSKKHPTPSCEETELYDRITKAETKIISKVFHLKKDKPRCDCRHFDGTVQNCEPYDSSVDYYQKFWKRFLLNELCSARLKQGQAQLSHFSEKIRQLGDLFQIREELTGGKGGKRERRHAHELIKNFACPYPKCFKGYSAEIALNLHIKLKHNGGTKTERQKAAELFWEARENHDPTPSLYINLPPGYIEQYGRCNQMKLLTPCGSKQQHIFEDND